MNLEIEIKPEVNKKYTISKKIDKFFEKYNLYDKAFVSSFDPRILYYIRSENPEVVTALSVHTKATGNKLVDFLLFRIWLADFLGVGIIEPNRKIADKRFIQMWQEKGKVLNIWTVNTKEEKRFFKGLGVSITTNCPRRECKIQSDEMESL